MSYEVGTHIDLTYLNTKPAVTPEPMFHAAIGRLVEPGTSVIFVKAPEAAAA